MRPYIICHMITSLDGRLKSEGCPQEFYKEYQRIESLHEADGWICGRITMEDFIGNTHFSAKTASKKLPKKDFIAPHKNKPIGVVIDPSGKLLWKSNTINGAHIVVVLTENVTDEYLTFLKSQDISYIFGGKTKIDLSKVLEKLVKQFKIKKLLLEGGGNFNGSMLREGFIDEVSLLLAPVIEGTIGTPTLFDVNETRKPSHLLKLVSTKKLKADILWLTYKTDKIPEPKTKKKK